MKTLLAYRTKETRACCSDLVSKIAALYKYEMLDMNYLRWLNKTKSGSRASHIKQVWKQPVSRMTPKTICI